MTRRRCGLHGRAMALLVLLLLACGCSALTLQVEPQQEECVFEDLEAGSSFKFEFEVIRGGLLDIQLKVYSPKNRVILDKMTYFSRKEDQQNEDEGKISFTAQGTGPHKICFDNTMSRWTAKVVTFRQGGAEEEAKAEIAKLEHLGPVVDSVIKISDDLDTIEKLQHRSRVREQLHRDEAETVKSRVQWLAIFQAALLVTLSAFQLQQVRDWFSDAGHAGRV